MPRLKLLLNIGTKDAPRLGLDAAKALAGEIVDVNDKAADEMLRRGWATDKLDDNKPVPGAAPVNSAGINPGATVQAVPSLEIKSDGGAKPDFAKPDTPVPAQPAKVEPAAPAPLTNPPKGNRP